MQACSICGKECESLVGLESHFASHAVRPVEERPLSYLLVLPDGVTSGRTEAASAFAQAFAELKGKHPDTNFVFMPFSYRTAEGEDPALDAILAVAPSSGMFVNEEGRKVEWFCGKFRPTGNGWVDQDPERRENDGKCWHRLMPA